MEEHKSDLVNSPEQQTDELNCPSHHRKRWAIDKTVFDWHRRLPLHDRPSLRWALAVVLALIIIAVMIIGIVFSAEYYTAYYASGAWAWSRERVNSTQGSLSRMEALTKASQLLQATSDDANQMVQNGTLDETVNMSYRPGILHTAPCDPRWSCRHYDQPAICCEPGLSCQPIDFDLSNSGIYCCNNSTCPVDGHLSRSAICAAHLMQCSLADGGGCCPYGTVCVTDGCLIRNENKPTTTKTINMPTNTADVPNVVATAHKMGEIPSQAIRVKEPGYTSQPGIEALLLSATVTWAWMMAVRG